MRRVLLVSLLSFLPALAHALTDEGFTIAGAVVSPATNRPFHKILVTLIAPNGKSVSAITGSDGRFRFLHVPKGKYILQANSRNGRMQQYRQHDQYSTGVVAGPGQDSENILFPFTAGASIGGTVLDENNEPVAQAQILVFRKAVVEGRFNVTQCGSLNTGGAGTFLLGDLPPGTYFVAAQAQAWFVQHEPGGPHDLDVVYPITYHDGVTDPNSARPIVLHEGESADISFILHAVPPLRLTMPDVPPEQNTGVNIQISSVGPGGISVPVPVFMNSTQESGGVRHAEVNGLPPGEYRVQTMAPNAAPSFGRLSLHSSTNFSALDLKSSPTLDGQLNFHGQRPAAQQVFVHFSCGNFLQVTPEGKFTSQGQVVKPGRCAVEVFNLPNAVLESLSVNGRVSDGETFEMPAAGNVHLVLDVSQTQSPGKCNGIVLHEGKPVAGALVLLVPEDQSRALRFRRDQSDSDGTFVLNNVRAGKYTLLAIDDGSEVAYLEPGELKPYLPSGLPLEFPLKTAEDLKVEVQKLRPRS